MNIIKRFRVEQAKKNILVGNQFIVAADECGFADQSHFSRIFKEVTGMSPTKWLQNNKSI